MSTDNDKLVQYLEEQLQQNPTTILFARLADIYLDMKKVDEAIEICEEGIKKHPYYVTGHMVLGKCYLEKKQHDQAEKEFKRVLFFDPKYLSAHKFFGDLMQEIGWEHTCETSYKKILQIDPLDEVARSRIAEFKNGDKIESEDMESLESFVSHSTESESEFEDNSTEPMPLSSGEEELLYQEEEQKIDQPENEFDIPTVDIDEKKAEEFSSILDDIFEDEVVKDEPPSPTNSDDVYSYEEDLVSEIQKDPQSYFKDSKSFEEDIQKSQSAFKSEFDQIEKLDFDQHSKKVADQLKPDSDIKEIRENSYQPGTMKKRDGEKIVTPTLGEIYAAQGQYAKAISVFELLLKKHPDNEVFFQKIEILKRKLEESKNAP